MHYESDQVRGAMMPNEAPLHTPLMVAADNAATLIGVSPATWHRMVAAGKTPAPVKLSAGCVRWRVADLQSWVDEGCPTREVRISTRNN